MIKRIAQTAGFAGLLAAVVLTLLQSLWVTPLILHAETFEGGDPATEVIIEHSHADGEQAHDHGVAGHSHDGEAWAPEDGWQRLLATGLSNLVVAVGFALMLAGLFTLRAPNQTWQGLLWGLAGFATFSLAPSLGLPPELPGTAAADLLLRQYWWIGAAASTAVGLALLAFAPHWALRILGLLILAVPHLIGAPHPEIHESLVPQAMEHEFILASLLTNVAFWIVLGLLAAWFYRKPAQGI